MQDAVASNSSAPRDADAAASAGVAAHARTRAISLLLAAAIVLGVGLRLKHYFARNAYWHDEASLVLNIFEKTATELMGPLSSAQAAAPGFLLLERGVYVLLGRSELAMRLPPLLASMAGIALFALLAWRVFGERAPSVALLLIVLWGCSERLIWHAAEAKQYSVDVLVSLALLSVALRQTRSHVHRLITSAAIASVAIWFSHPTAFVFGGISLALVPSMWRTRRDLLTWLACNALFGVSFIALYFASVRNQQVAALYQYWAPQFVDFSRPWSIPGWFLRQLQSLCNYPFDLGGPVLMPLAIVGGISLWRHGRRGGHDGADGDDGERRRGREVVRVLLMPAALVLVAAALKQYPFTGTRLTLFLAPNVFLLAGFGVVALLDWAARRKHGARHWRRLAIAVPAYLLAVAAWWAAVYIVRPPVYGNMPAVVRYVAAHDAPQDVFFVNKISEFRCYWPDVPQQQLRDAKELDAHVPDGRFWLVLSYRKEKAVEGFVHDASREAARLDTFKVTGGAALLFDGIDGPSTRSTARTE
jgi:hypothetical protein